jgi:hypothetical protein
MATEKGNKKTKETKKQSEGVRWWLVDNICPLTVLVVTSSGSETFLPAKQNLRATGKKWETRARKTARNGGYRCSKKQADEENT